MGTGLELQRYLDIPAHTRATHIMQPDARVEPTGVPHHARAIPKLVTILTSIDRDALPEPQTVHRSANFLPRYPHLVPHLARLLPLARMQCGELSMSQSGDASACVLEIISFGRRRGETCMLRHPYAIDKDG